MNLDKLDVKVGVANELGVRLDDMFEANVKDYHRLEGAVQALQAAAGSIGELIKLVDKDVDEGKFDLEQAGVIKRYMIRAQQVVINMSLKSENNRIAQSGRMAAFEQAVQVVKKFKDEEQRKAETLREALKEAQAKAPANGSNGSAPVEVELRPGLSVKARRLAEEASQKAAEGVSATETSPEGTLAPQEAVPVKKRGGRRKTV